MFRPTHKKEVMMFKPTEEHDPYPQDAFAIKTANMLKRLVARKEARKPLIQKIKEAITKKAAISAKTLEKIIPKNKIVGHKVFIGRQPQKLTPESYENIANRRLSRVGAGVRLSRVVGPVTGLRMSRAGVKPTKSNLNEVIMARLNNSLAKLPASKF